MKGIHYEKSQTILSYYFHFEPNSIPAKIVAVEIDVPYPTLMKFVSGTQGCPPEIFVKIYEVTRYEPFARLLTPDGHRLSKTKKAIPDKATVEEELLDDHRSTAKITTIWCALRCKIIAGCSPSDCSWARLFSAISEKRCELDETEEKIIEARNESDRTNH